jgi:hypothetical protein
LLITTLPNASGNPYIDGLTTEAARGQLTPVVYTPGSTISYFFDTDARGWSDSEKAAVRLAWDSWEKLINLNIEETAARENATVLMQISNLPDGVLGEATAPVDGVVPATNKTAAAGNALQFISVGGDSYLTLVHEIGHNLGIYHPHNSTLFPGVPEGGENVLGTNNMNQNIWTTLSYNVGYDLEPRIDLAFGNAMGPMTLDIAAAQFAYGARAANTGNDTYLLPSQNAVGTGWQAIWDTGGVDTLSAAGVTGATTIDLRAASLVGDAPGGYVSWAPGIKGGFTIANGVVVENVIGGAGVDTVTGNEADNVFTGGGGNDVFNGGGGTDTLIMNAARAAATVTIDKNGTIRIADRNGPEGQDVVTGVETIQFTNGTIDLNQFSSATQLSATQFTELAEMYVAYFNRAADSEGLFFWADKLAEGMDLKTIASFFSQSAEAKALYPNTADTSGFVTAVYSNVLGRTPDQAGFDFWTSNLNSGAQQASTFVLNIIGGAKLGTSAADVAYLAAKANLGVYFSAIKGMSDVADAQNVLNIFGDAATSNTAAARAAVDGHYTDATASGTGDFVFELVGVVNDPFAIA